MLSEIDISYIKGRLGRGSVEPRFLGEATDEYKRIADPGVSERDFVFGYIFGSNVMHSRMIRENCTGSD